MKLAEKCHETSLWRFAQNNKSRTLAQKIYDSAPENTEEWIFGKTGIFEEFDAPNRERCGDVDLFLWPEFSQRYGQQNLILDTDFSIALDTIKKGPSALSTIHILNAAADLGHGKKLRAFSRLKDIDFSDLQVGPLASFFGYLCWQNGEKELGLDYMFQSLEFKNSGIRTTARLADHLARKGMTDGAASLYHQISELTHNVVVARIWSIDFWLAHGELDLAEKNLKKLEDQIGKIPVVAKLKFPILKARGKTKQSQELKKFYLERYIDISSRHSRYVAKPKY